MSKSLIELAYDYISASNGEVAFENLWKYVVSESGLPEEEANKKVGQFYTNIMLDGRFVTLGENKWDLRSRHTFDKVHIDMKDVYSDVEQSDSDEEEVAEEKEYNEQIDAKEEKDETEEIEETKDDSSDYAF